MLEHDRKYKNQWNLFILLALKLCGKWSFHTKLGGSSWDRLIGWFYLMLGLVSVVITQMLEHICICSHYTGRSLPRYIDIHFPFPFQICHINLANKTWKRSFFFSGSFWWAALGLCICDQWKRTLGSIARVVGWFSNTGSDFEATRPWTNSCFERSVIYNHPIGKDYKWYISGIFPANWGIIWYLPPIKGTRKLHWFNQIHPNSPYQKTLEVHRSHSHLFF